ncbi:MAG TPA: DUF222 domain-containing protein, partial [Streptosporangiaceae bacterium]
MTSNDVLARDQVLAELAALGPGSGDALALLTQVRQAAVFADQVMGELARLAGVVDRTGAFAAAGYSCAAAFFRHGCGRSVGRSGELVAVGRALPRLTATGQALALGLVSFDAAHVICRAVAQISDDDLAAAAEQEMLGAATIGLPGSRSAAEALARPTSPEAGDSPGESAAADPATDGNPAETAPGQPEGEATLPPQSDGWAPPGLDPRELRRLGEDLTYRADPDAVEERQRARFERRYLSFGLTLDNVGTISGACSDSLSMEIIKTAAEAFSPPGGTGDQRTAAQRRMDGLTAACQAALDSGRAGSRHGAMPHVTVLLDTPATPGQPTIGGSRPPGEHDQDQPYSGLARTGHGALLTARQVLALACRAELSVIRWRDGLPLDVGRRYRTETPAIRRALIARDRGCRWPGCGLPATWCTAHHIHPWKHGGTTRLPGLVLLCFVHHHYFTHLLGWTLSGSPDGLLRFTHPHGHLTL